MSNPFVEVQSRLKEMGAQEGDLVLLGGTAWTVQQTDDILFLVRVTAKRPGTNLAWEEFLAGNKDAAPILYRKM